MTCDELRNKEIGCDRLKKLRNIIVPVLGGIFVVLFIVGSAINNKSLILISLLVGIPVTAMAFIIFKKLYEKKTDDLYSSIESSIMDAIGITKWEYTDQEDDRVFVKSSRSVTGYNDMKYFRENPACLSKAIALMRRKRVYQAKLSTFLDDNDFKSLEAYPSFASRISANIANADAYHVLVRYTSPAGRKESLSTLHISESRLLTLDKDKSLIMSKADYSKYRKELEANDLVAKQKLYYKKINAVIDLANENKERLVTERDEEELDNIINKLLDIAESSIRKIKKSDSEDWDLLGKIIFNTDKDVKKIIDKNNLLLKYYNSDAFAKLKETCNNLMESQREFNEYIDEKVKSITDLFGTQVARNETTHEDEYNYIHPYQKSITPFTAEVSAAVFASAENSPLEYVVKHFYPSRESYPEQIRKLQVLVEELETLNEAKHIIDQHKAEIQQYIADVPEHVMKYDEDGFYSRLGFATINEKTLTVEYKFAYTSNSGRAQRSFTVPMTEETIVRLIEMLESKLTMTAFSKEQRSLMTSKLRQQIKERDDYTCKYCGNSTHKEPNLLLEIDHIIPVAKGGYTREDNLQTLCWKCNRSKSDKLI